MRLFTKFILLWILIGATWFLTWNAFPAGFYSVKAPAVKVEIPFDKFETEKPQTPLPVYAVASAVPDSPLLNMDVRPAPRYLTDYVTGPNYDRSIHPPFVPGLAAYDRDFGRYFKKRRYLPSCVWTCDAKGVISIPLFPGEICDHANRCTFEKHADREQRVTQGNCTSEHSARCPLPYNKDCSGYSINTWTLSLEISKSIVTLDYILLVISEARPFSIFRIYPDADSDNIIVNSFFLPVSYQKNGCNTLFCVYEYPNGRVEETRAIPGDYSFTYCPKMKSISATPVSLRLTYDHVIFSHPIPWQVSTPRKELPHVQLTICAIVRGEGPNLQEWIEYHLMMGYKRFVLYDNNLATDELMDKIVSIYRDVVIIVPWKYRHTQSNALTDCKIRYGEVSDWMSFIDVDEFMIPHPDYPDVASVLNARFQVEPYLLSHWVTFGPCGEMERNASQLTTEICRSTTLAKGMKPMPKPTFQPKHVGGIQGFSPHVVRLKSDMGKSASSIGTKTDEYLRIYHYRYRTWPEFHRRRLGDTAARTIHRSENDVQRMWVAATKNLAPLPDSQNNILRFLPTLKKRMNERIPNSAA
eukprot:TRINITY_DN8624_c0_g1_i1.p1 TRINITY_DN8624_c0_g1~~TRINITY_DN8624_c0_g1_i1.p1  ORF type:complete len:583 (+),score=94.50 TRINITY_DN8624_c0_g1_i1:69-1817(+)